MNSEEKRTSSSRVSSPQLTVSLTLFLNRSRGKVWFREHNKNPGAGGGFRAELLAGHEAALRSEEVSWRPEVPARVAEVLRGEHRLV